MKARTLLILGSLLAGCTPSFDMYPRFRYREIRDYKTVKAGAEAEYIHKAGTTSLLLGPGADHLPNAADFALDARVEDLFTRPPAGDDEYVFQFVHISDIQIRDRTRDFGYYISRWLDNLLVETAQNGFHQDYADVFYLGYLLKAVRGASVRGDLDLVVHTGDALQIGTDQELQAFNQSIGHFLLGSKTPERWRDAWRDHTGVPPTDWTPWIRTRVTEDVPFLQALGNHDVMQSGIFVRDGKADSLLEGYDWGIASFRQLRQFVSKSLGVPDAESDPETTLLDKHIRRGFFARKFRHVLAVVLNTNEVNAWQQGWSSNAGTGRPAISRTQFEWLAEILRSADDPKEKVDAVLVFGHNLLGEIAVGAEGEDELDPTAHDRTMKARKDSVLKRRELSNLLLAHAKVRGYFSGHVHTGSPPIEWRKGDRTLVEFVSPSVQEYPKSFAVITVRKPKDGAVKIETRHFNLEDLASLRNARLRVLHALNRIDVEIRAMMGQDSTSLEDIDSHPARFRRWLRALDEADLTKPERMLVLAHACYRSARADLHKQRKKRREFTEVVDQEYREFLKERYRPGQNFLEAINGFGTWDEHRRLLERRNR